MMIRDNPLTFIVFDITMPITLDINRSKDLSIITFTGDFNFHELINTLNHYGKRQPTLNEIYDIRAMTAEGPSSNELYDLARYLKAYADSRPSNSKTAVIAEKDLHFGSSRMIGMFLEFEVHYQVNVFRCLDDAHQWLET